MVDGLPDAAARDLLAAVAAEPSALRPSTGSSRKPANPLALVELGTAYPTKRLRPRRAARAASARRPPTGAISCAWCTACRQPPRSSPCSPADPETKRAHLWRAAARAGIDPDAASSGPRGRCSGSLLTRPCRYPLVRSAVYHGASVAERPHAHRMLGETGDSELRGWRLAAAANAPDEELAAELQRTAERWPPWRLRGQGRAAAALGRADARRRPPRRARSGSRGSHADGRRPGRGPGGARRRRAPAHQPGRGPGAAPSGCDPVRAGGRRHGSADAGQRGQGIRDDDRLARDTMLGALEAAIWSGPALARGSPGWRAHSRPPALPVRQRPAARGPQRPVHARLRGVGAAVPRRGDRMLARDPDPARA